MFNDSALKMSEVEFTRYLIDILNLHGMIVFPQNSRVTKTGSRYVPGTPDIIFLNPFNDKAYLWEVKTEKGVPKKSQLEMKKQCAEKGFDRYIFIRPSNYMEWGRICGVWG